MGGITPPITQFFNKDLVGVTLHFSIFPNICPYICNIGNFHLLLLSILFLQDEKHNNLQAVAYLWRKINYRR